jgi:small conductance mechanosensitive channel
MYGPVTFAQTLSRGDVQTRLIQTAGLIVGLILLYFIMILISRRMMQRFERDQVVDQRERRYLTMWSFLRRVTFAVIVVLAIPAVLSIWGVSLGPLVAVGGAVGVAVGFGAQNFIRDVVSGFLILAENQYRIGDVIDIAGVRGTVEDIQVRLTVLRDLDGNVHYVPNGLIQVTSNLTQQYARAVIDLGVAYGEDIDRVLAVVEDELRLFAEDPEWADVILEEPKVMGVDQLGDSSVVIRCLVKVNAEKRHPVRRELLRRFKNRFDHEGIEIPFPTQTVHLVREE